MTDRIGLCDAEMIDGKLRTLDGGSGSQRRRTLLRPLCFLPVPLMTRFSHLAQSVITRRQQFADLECSNGRPNMLNLSLRAIAASGIGID